jgi:polyhydroxybutyrate depolymerase
MVRATRAVTALLSVVAFMVILVACRPQGTPISGPPTLASGRSDHSLTVDERPRIYHVYVPASLNVPATLVMVLHGGFGSGIQAEQDYGWDTEADHSGFLVVYPDGLDRAWNVDGGGCCGQPAKNGVDDVAFLRAVVEDVERALAVDPKRVFVTGISNGGIMACRLACDTTLFAAIGPDSATMLGACPKPAPTRVIHIHGTADTRIPYQGGPGNGSATIDGPPVPEVAAASAAASTATCSHLIIDLHDSRHRLSVTRPSATGVRPRQPVSRLSASARRLSATWIGCRRLAPSCDRWPR